MAGFRAQAQTLEVIPLSQAWNYNASSNDLGQAWHATDYDDSTWDSGPAPLGREPDPIPVPIVTPLPYGPITHYFRTTFVFPTNAVGWTLSTTNLLVDDGVVLYLNDLEVARFNVALGAPPLYSTLANTKVDNAVFSSLWLRDGALRQGTNILAAEVHQESATSRDIVWALGLEATYYGAPVFVTQPPNVLRNEHVFVYFTAGVAEGPTFDLQWFKDGTPLRGVEHYSGKSGFGQWSSSVGINDLGPAGVGSYWAVASNAVGVVTSQVAHVDYIHDTAPPVAVFATVRTNAANWLRIAFNELPELASATNPANYVLTNSHGGVIPVLEARVGGMPFNGYPSDTNVFLRVGEMPFGPHYILAIQGIRDRAWSPNTISGDTVIPVFFEIPFLGYGMNWRYRSDGVDPGPTWLQTDYDDSAWPAGPGILGVENNSPLPEPIRTPLPLHQTNGEWVITSYFRTRFDLPRNLEQPRCALNAIVDDGAAFYLNEHEFFRVRLATNALGTDYAAINAPEPQQLVSTGPIPASFLAARSNLLAVEVHQVYSGSVDILLGVELLILSPAPLPLVRLEPAGPGLILRWEMAGATLESARQIEGPWDPVPGATNGQTIAVEGPARFFRLRN
jgi:hypothetical protein